MSALAKHLLLVCRAGLPCVGFGYVRSFVELFGGLPCVGFGYVCSCVELIRSCRVSALAKRLLVCRAGLPCVGFS